MKTDAGRARKIAVFFDLDGTLLPGPSLERRFVRALRECGCMRLRNYFLGVLEALWLLPRGVAYVRHSAKSYLGGISVGQASLLLGPFPFFDQALSSVAWHASEDHQIVLLSGTLEPLAQLVGRALECELEARAISACVWVAATRLEEQNGRWTGRRKGEAIYGAAKARAAEALALRCGLDLGLSYAYANDLADRPLFEAVGHARVVNPGRELAALALRKEWPIEIWREQGPLPRAHPERRPVCEKIGGPR